MREIISRFIDNFDPSNPGQEAVFKNDLIEENFFYEKSNSLGKIISKFVNKANNYTGPNKEKEKEEQKENLEQDLVKSKSFCEGRYFFNGIDHSALSSEGIKNLISILPKIIKYEKEADEKGEELVVTILKKVQTNMVNYENKSAAKAALKVFVKDRADLLFVKNILTGCDPKQTSVCINNRPLPVVPKEQEETQSNPSEELETVINDPQPSILEEQGVIVEAQPSLSEGLEAASNDPQPNTLEEQKVVVETQPSTPKANRHLLCCFYSFFVREKGNTEQYELRSLNTVEDLSPSIPEQQETVVEVSQPSTSEKEEMVELRKQEAVITNLRPNTPAPEQKEAKDSQPDIPENTVRSLLSRYKQKKPETKPEDGSLSEGNSMKMAFSPKR